MILPSLLFFFRGKNLSEKFQEVWEGWQLCCVSRELHSMHQGLTEETGNQPDRNLPCQGNKTACRLTSNPRSIASLTSSRACSTRRLRASISPALISYHSCTSDPGSDSILSTAQEIAERNKKHCHCSTTHSHDKTMTEVHNKVSATVDSQR